MIKQFEPMIKDLKDELQKYVGTNIYRCPLCEKTFEWDDYYYNPEEKVYICPCCLTELEEYQLLKVNVYELFEDMFLAYRDRNQIFKEKDNERD